MKTARDWYAEGFRITPVTEVEVGDTILISYVEEVRMEEVSIVDKSNIHHVAINSTVFLSDHRTWVKKNDS